MLHQEFEPPEELRDAIKCFWYNKRDFGEIQTGFEVVPDGYAEIIFYFGSVCSIAHNGGLQPLPSPFMVGLLNQPVLFYAKNCLEIIAIRCFPWTVFDLLGLPSGKNGVHIFEHPVARLQSSLSKWIEAGQIDEALAEVKQYFLTERSRIAMDSMLFKAGVAMSKAKGSMPVSQVAAAAHATVRTLERKFKQSSGYTVKDVSGLMRFEQVRNHLWHNPNSNIAGLAHELGYADQSHLSREFKRYSGTTPAAFARKAKRKGNGLLARILSRLYKLNEEAFRNFVLQSCCMKTTLESHKSEQNQSIYDVIISGAGPVGLFLACELALAQCSVLILEKAENPHSPLKQLPFGMRGLSAPTIEALYRRGLLKELEVHKRHKSPHVSPASGQGSQRQAGHFAGIPFYEGNIERSQWSHRLPSSTETSLLSEMAELESILSRRAENLGVEIKRRVAIIDFHQTADGVTVQSADLSFKGRWLVGCDGSRSVVRKAGGFEFAGTEPEFTGYTVRVDMADPEKLRPGRNVTEKGMYLQSQPGYLMMQDFDAGAFHNSEKPVTLEHVQAVARRISNTDVTFSALHTATTWTDRARQATTYRNGRLLLAGDAAHIHSPLGGQGLNLGLGDAMNLGWKLAATIQKKAPEGLLDSYHTERQPIGAQVLDWSRAQVAIMRPGPQARALYAIFRDLMNTRDGATYIAGRVWGVFTNYDLGGGHPLAGHSVPNFEFEDGIKLGGLMHDGQGILLDFDRNASLKTLAGEYGSQIKYISDRVKDRLGLRAALIRPDGIIAWASDHDPDCGELQKAIARWFVITQ